MAILGSLNAGLGAYHYLMMMVVCMGSVTYGYAVCVIGTSLGKQYNSDPA